MNHDPSSSTNTIMDNTSSSFSTLQSLFNNLEMQKEIFWLENKHLPPDELQRQWSDKTAQLVSVLSPTAPVPRLDLDIEAHGQREMQQLSTIPRVIPDMARPDSDNLYACNLDRDENLSHGSAPMSRKRSSSSQNGTTSFTSTDSTVSPLTLNSYQHDDEEPFSNYTISKPPKMRRTASGRHPVHVPALIYEDPKDFFDKSETALSPTVPFHQRSHRSSRHLSSSPAQPPILSQLSPVSQSPATPISDGLTYGTTYTSGNMSRQSSHAGSSIVGGLDMMRLNSQRSDVNSNLSRSIQDSPLDLSQSLAPNGCSSSQFGAQFSFLVGHAGGMYADTLHSYDSSAPKTSPLQSLFDAEATIMKRSSSSETNGSSQSRVSRRSQEQLKQSSRPIAPKLDDETMMSRQASTSSTSSKTPSDHQMVRIRSEDGSMKDVVPIAKAPYVRPTHDKVKCDLCDEHPEGFRGEHEIRRHKERAHSVLRKAFICVDISPNKKFLASCKACRNNKKYYAYYNAAAHLRRAHFNPKPKGRKSKGSIKPEEKRGGKGGGNEPSMEVLKKWMVEIEDRVPRNMLPHEDGEDEEDPMHGVPDSMVQNASLPSSRNDPFSQHSFAPSTQSLNVAGANPNAYIPSMFTPSTPTQRSPYSTPLHLARPQQGFAANDPDILDFSQSTIANGASNSVATDFEDVFNMSPLFENPQFFDGLDGSGFPDMS